MSTHSFHPSILEHGLADGCWRCAEIATDPFTGLDSANLALLTERTRQWMKDAEFPRSENEGKAMRLIQRHLIDRQILEHAEKRSAA